jgi:exosortase J
MESSALTTKPALQDFPTAAPKDRRTTESRLLSAPHARVWWCLAALAVLGTVGMAPIMLKLWDIWTSDPLASIGMLIVPVSVILTLRVWRQCGSELHGSWWGLLPVLLGLFMSTFPHSLGGRLLAGPIDLHLTSPSLILYLFGSGFILLFAGRRVWKRAWFPLALLLCAKAVPHFFLTYGDLPLQDASAHIARSFAVLIGFPPTSQELLRLMFAPRFGMFIAPGCDGIRGALTMGYLALIIGYLKKVSLSSWIMYTLGGVALGYFFNLIRLCALVVYYRIALGHDKLEHFSEKADYIIGGCLFLVAVLLFLWIAIRASAVADTANGSKIPQIEWGTAERRLFPWRAAVFAIPASFFAIPGVHAIRTYQRTFAAEVRDGIITRAQLDALLPKKLSGYTLNRIWQEVIDGQVQIESGAYTRSQRDEAILGVWLPPLGHSLHVSWMTQGKSPLQRHNQAFLTAKGSTEFDTAFYSDGIADSIAGNAFCTPVRCIPSPQSVPEGLTFTFDPTDFETRGKRAVSIFFHIDRPHTSGDQTAVYHELMAEAQEFLAGVDFGELSRLFQ